MFHLKTLLFIVLSVSALFSAPGPKDQEIWVIREGCSLKVQGSTNINQFSCVIANISKPDTLRAYRTDGGPIRMGGVLKLDIRSFDCFNPMMTADLRKTLKVKEFPHLVIRFISLTELPDPDQSKGRLHGVVNIEMAGVAKKFDVAYQWNRVSKDRMILKGTREIHFSDFSIVPPRKIGGMIQTNDALNAEFNLVLQVLKP